jgi:putative glutathione S-transferase
MAIHEVSATGAFVRTASTFRNDITEEEAVPGRYHLYVSYACPWAHRTLIVRSLKGLEDVISLSVVHYTFQKTRPEDPTDEHCGWVFKSNNDSPVKHLESKNASFPCIDCIEDNVNNCKTVRELYDKCGYDGHKFTVPILWDKEKNTIVNNESSEIIRILNNKFNKYAKNPSLDLYPESLRPAIDDINTMFYEPVNNGVYKCGFAKAQGPYNDAVETLFNTLDQAEEILSNQRYLAGDQFTEADIRAFVTLVRFDEVYVVYFKTNKKRIADYPNILNFIREIYQMKGIAETTNFDHIKGHYYSSHPHLNIYGVIPAGPNVTEDLMKPHNREELVPSSKRSKKN